MNNTTKEQYEFALQRIEELLPLVDDNTPANNRNAVELTLMSDIVIAYEKEHFPINKPTVVGDDMDGLGYSTFAVRISFCKNE